MPKTNKKQLATQKAPKKYRALKCMNTFLYPHNNPSKNSFPFTHKYMCLSLD